jgi:hypothetical protein
MGLQDYITGATDNTAQQYQAEAELERAKRLRMKKQTEQAAEAERQAAAEAERQANADAMQQAAMQYQQQQQGVQQGYEQDAAKGLDQFGLLRLLGDFNTGHEAATQGLSQGMSALSGDAGRADAALAPTMIPQRAQQQAQQPSIVGQASMQPQSLYESIIAQAEGTGSQISAKTKEAKERAKALLRVIRSAR